MLNFKQHFLRRKRLSCLIVALITLFQVSFAATFSSNLYLDLSEFTGWEDAEAWFGVIFRNGSSTYNAKFEKVNGKSHFYEVAVPSGEWTSCDVIRMNPTHPNLSDLSSGSGTWNGVYNISANGIKDCIKITGWTAGSLTSVPTTEYVLIESSDWSWINGQKMEYNSANGRYEISFPANDFNGKNIKFFYNGKYLDPVSSGSYYIQTGNLTPTFNLSDTSNNYYINWDATGEITISIDIDGKTVYFSNDPNKEVLLPAPTIVRDKGSFTPNHELHKTCPVYPSSVYEAGRDWSAWNRQPTAYLCSPVLNNERINSDWEMTYTYHYQYGWCYEIKDVTLRSTICANKGTKTTDERIYATIFDDPQNGEGQEVAFTKLILTEKRNFHLANASGREVGLNAEGQSTPGQPFNVYLYKNGSGEWELDFERPTDAEGNEISGMPYIGMTSYNYVIFKPGTTEGYLTPRGGKNANRNNETWSSAHGWQEAYLLYDKRGNLLLDRNGYVQYSTQWPPKNKIYFSSYVPGAAGSAAQQIEVSSANTSFQTRYIAKTGEEWKKEAAIDPNTKGIEELKDDQQYIRYIIPHAWLLGVFKVWTGWTGGTWNSGANAQWDNHINWGAQDNNKKDDDDGYDFPAGNIIKSVCNASNFKINTPTYFKAIEFYYNISDPKNNSVIRTVKAYGMPRVFGRLKGDSQNFTEYNIQLIESPNKFTEGETVKKCVVRRFDAISSTANPWDANNGGWVAVDRHGNEVDRNSDDAIVSVFDFENGNYTGVSEDMMTQLGLNSVNSPIPVKTFQNKFTADTWFDDGELSIGRYFYGFEVIYGSIDSNTKQNKREEVKSSAIIVRGGSFSNRLNAYQIIKVNDKGREYIKSEFERKGIEALNEEDLNNIVYLTYSDDESRTFYSLKADKTIRRIVSDDARKEVMRDIFKHREYFDWTFDSFIVGYMPDDFSRYTRENASDKFSDFVLNRRGVKMENVTPIIVNDSRDINDPTIQNDWKGLSRWYAVIPAEDIDDTNYTWSIKYPKGTISMGEDTPIDIEAGTTATSTPTRLELATPSAKLELVNTEVIPMDPAMLDIDGQEHFGRYNRVKVTTRVVEPNIEPESMNLIDGKIGYQLAKYSDKSAISGICFPTDEGDPTFVLDRCDPENELKLEVKTLYKEGTVPATYSYNDESAGYTTASFPERINDMTIQGSWGYANEEKDKYILAISRIDFEPNEAGSFDGGLFDFAPDCYQLTDATDSRHLTYITDNHFNKAIHIQFTEPKTLVGEAPSEAESMISLKMAGFHLYDVDMSDVKTENLVAKQSARQRAASEDGKIRVTKHLIGETSAQASGNQLTGVADADYSNVVINAGRGFIEVAGAEHNAVYSVDGALIGADSQRYELPSGIYIVRADGATRKVVVR